MLGIVFGSFGPSLGRQPAIVMPSLALIGPSGPQSARIPFDIRVRVSDVTALGAFELDLDYDRSRLRLIGATLGDFLGRQSDCNPAIERCSISLSPRDQSNIVELGAYSYGTGDGADGDGMLLILHFQPSGRGGVARLCITRALLADTHAVALAPTTVDTTVQIATLVYLPVVRR